jgi:trk system potassium uptake protein TrkH
VALFHAVSGFCNAGFSTFGDSLVGWAAYPSTVLTMALLLILGGLGFTVVANVLGAARARLARRPRSQRPRLTVQTRVTLLGTAALLGGGTALLLLLEPDGALGQDAGPALRGAFFQAATARTAGFHTIDVAALGPPALLALMLLMFVGAGSGSTAGGIKLPTVAVIAADLRAITSGRRHPRLLDRELTRLDTARATAVLSVAVLLAVLGTFLLLVTEQTDLLTAAFEAISALGTVGLSLGLTAELSPAGKVVVMVLMLVGRLGVLTVAYGLVQPASDPAVRLPRGEIMIG